MQRCSRTAASVPKGWEVSDYQGTALTVMNPPVLIPRGPRLTIERLTGSIGASAARTVRAGKTLGVSGPTAIAGTAVIAGHTGRYQCL